MDGKDAMPTNARSDDRLTYDDFLLFPDDGKRHEIIDGEHYVTPSPTAAELLASERATLTTPILPGWSLTMDQLFA